MYIVHVASEFAPLVKVGGLGDVVHGLAKQQGAQGHRVEVILPKYDLIQYQNLERFSLDMGDLWSFEDSSRYHNAVWSGYVDQIKTLLIEPHHNDYYFNRGRVYGCHDDVERFLYFSRTVGELLHLRKDRPDIIHLHDWPTASLAPILKHIYSHLGFSYGALVLTIHNIEHQGRCAPANLSRVGLRGEDFRTEERLQDPKDPALLNLLKGGVVYADHVTTVSPTYAKEIMTPSLGFGLDNVIRKYESRLTGILNGIELDSWNPSKDPNIPFPYPTNPTFIDTILKSKEINKETLYKKLGLKASKGPLVACISRLAKQKGPGLIAQAIHYTLKQNGSFILLGSSLDPEFEKEFQEIQATYKYHPHFYMKLSFDEPFSHHLYAAADLIFIPSLFEPCGLTQMIAMRYGTIPVARKTGGLADTIFDADDPSLPLIKRNGFLFEHPEPASAEKALKRAFSSFEKEKLRWKTLIQNGLTQDFGWKQSAMLYETIYTKLLKPRNFKAA